MQRLVRTGQITHPEHREAELRFDLLRGRWREVQPSQSVREEAERLLMGHPLKGADALQLAAAAVWASGTPQTRTFLSGDTQLLRAARHFGFQVIKT